MEASAMVMEKARPRLEKLAKLAPQLNEATDRYMDELRAIEAELREMNLGLAIELDSPLKSSAGKIEIGEDIDGEDIGVVYHEAWHLGYERIDSNIWGFVVRSYKVYEPPDDEEQYQERNVIPLLKASRELRLAAAEQIPTLLEEIEKAAQRKIAALKEVSDR
jgi:hypothetical protein